MKILFRYIRLFWGCMSHILVILAVLCLLITGLGVVFGVVEGRSLTDSVYFAFVTAFTIGYGDIVPTTAAGKVLAVVLSILGMVFLGIVVAISNRTIMLIMHPPDGH